MGEFSRELSSAKGVEIITKWEQQPIFICSLFLTEPEINLVQGK